ncbi:MAG: ABC transporter substrate-binding protein [Oscillospiraceae bacterium]|nr:ABC transporter substrate-binding protein [Oscillospiraceae bacterium]
MKRIIVLLLALALVLCLCACGGQQTAGHDTFVFGDYVGNVDPASSAYAWVGIRTGVMESLFKFDENMNVQKNLVEDYSVSDDGMTWTIVLKKGITFQNGNACDAEAVKASFERTCAMQARADGELKIASMEADGLTLKVTTREPNPTLPNCMCDPYSGIVDVKSLDEDGNATIGTGPFKLVEYVENERMELDAYDGYWQGKPASRHVTIRSISDLDASSLALQKGELDACYGLSYDARSLFDGVSGFKISQAATSRVYKIYFNHEHEFTGDPVFRKAVCMAVDRENYAAVLVNGAGTPTKSTFPASTAFGGDSLAANVPDFDLDGARALLTENGYTDTDGDGIIEKGGKPVSLQIITYGRAGLPQSSQALASALKQIGIDATVEQLESTEERANAGTYDLSVYAEVTLPTGDPYSYMMNNYRTGGIQNYGKYSDPEADALIDELAAEFDAVKRAELAKQIDTLVLAENNICNMYHLNMYMAMKDTVDGLVQSPVDYYHITYQTRVR